MDLVCERKDIVDQNAKKKRAQGAVLIAFTITREKGVSKVEDQRFIKLSNDSSTLL